MYSSFNKSIFQSMHIELNCIDFDNGKLSRLGQYGQQPLLDVNQFNFPNTARPRNYGDRRHISIAPTADNHVQGCIDSTSYLLTSESRHTNDCKCREKLTKRLVNFISWLWIFGYLCLLNEDVESKMKENRCPWNTYDLLWVPQMRYKNTGKRWTLNEQWTHLPKQVQVHTDNI